jgi:DNA-binding NarL/FixJ family response regulator
MIRVLLVDDHVLVRTGLRMVLAEQVDMQCVGEADDGEEALTLIRKTRPDVVLCDLHMPGLSGLELTERLVRMNDGPRVIVVSMQDDGPLPRRVLEAGAAGYVSKSSGSAELLRAVRDVARGKRYIGADIAQSLALGSVATTSESPFDALSARELQITMMLVQGIRTGDMARQLNLSPKTVSTHKYRLLRKLDLPDVMSLARLASQHGLVDPAHRLAVAGGGA